MSVLVDAHGRPLSAASSDPVILVPDGPRLHEGAGGYQASVPEALPVRMKMRRLVVEAMRRGWDPNTERLEEMLCVELPLVYVVELLEERDALAWADAAKRVCTSCTGAIGAEDLR